MKHEEKIKDTLARFNNRFFLSRNRRDQLGKLRVAFEDFGRFKEDQLRIMVEKAYERIMDKTFHPDEATNKSAIVGARILADELLSELKQDELL